MAKAKSHKSAATAAVDRVSQALTTTVAATDVARRAYDLYLARDGEHGHDVDDWLQAERELRNTAHSTAA